MVHWDGKIYYSASSLFSSFLIVTSSLSRDQEIYYYYIIIIPVEFFTSVLADGFSLESEWQQVSSGLQDSSQYSACSQQCCHLDSLYPSSNFQVLQAF